MLCSLTQRSAKVPVLTPFDMRPAPRWYNQRVAGIQAVVVAERENGKLKLSVFRASTSPGG